MKRFSSLLITVFILIACQSQEDVTQTIPANTSTPEITLTSTSQPITPPQPTQTTLSIEFPDWVKNPDTQILLVPVGTHDKGYENMALFNAETGERFDIPFTEKERDYFWMPDGLSFGFLDKNKRQVDLFSVKGGTIINFPISKESFRFLSDDIKSLETLTISKSNLSDSSLLFLYTWDKLSVDKRYFIYQETYDENYTSVFDIYTSETIHVSNPNDEFIDLYSEWSPNSSLLAIVEVDQLPDMFTTFQVLPTFRLRIYDVESQEVVASYKNVTFPKWSQDGTKFLFQEWIKRDNFFWYGDSPPCIFNTISGTTKCYNVGEGVLNSVEWSPDQRMIGYVYFDGNGGFCKVLLSSDEIECILSNLETEDQVPLGYIWSPDSRFIVFGYDTTSPYAAYIDKPKVGIANVETGEYFSIGENVTFINLGLWRPSLNP